MSARTAAPTAAVLAALVIAALMPATAAAEAERLVDLGNGDDDTTVLGSPNKDQLGNDLRAGDVTGDGVADLVMGAHWSSGSGRNIVGRSYVLFGGEDWPATVDLINRENADWGFFGRGREARMGSAVGTGDLSGDGVGDLLLGSLLADPIDRRLPEPEEQHNGGAVYVMFGGSDVGGYHDFLYESSDALIAGDARHTESDQLGTDLVTGDFNADGQTDVAVAAAFRKQSIGAVFAWWGPIEPGAMHNLRTEEADWAIVGPSENSWFGSAIAVGDITGDGVDDLLASAITAGRADEPTNSGAVFVFAGGPSAGGSLDLAHDQPTALITAGEEDHIGTAIAVGTCSCRGHPVHVADVTGDGRSDLLIGAPLQGRRSGAMYLLEGPIDGGVIDLTTARHGKLTAPQDEEGRLGWWIETGHLDGDGKVDLVVAAPWAAGGDVPKAGVVYGFRGPLAAHGTSGIAEADPPLLVFGSEENSGNAGASLVLADTSGDGVDDFHIGLPDAAPAGRRSSGVVFVVRGPLLDTLATATPTPTATPTASPTPTPTSTATPTATPTSTSTPTPTAPATSTATASPSPVASATPTAPPPLLIPMALTGR